MIRKSSVRGEFKNEMDLAILKLSEKHDASLPDVIYAITEILHGYAKSLVENSVEG